MATEETNKKASKGVVEVLHEPQWSLKEPNFVAACTFCNPVCCVINCSFSIF
jgi:hypothetical protein